MRLTLLALALSVCACSDDKPDYTLGEFCDELSTELCQRYVACGIASFNACFQGAKGGCCLNAGTCEQAEDYAESRAYIDTCAPSLRVQRCDEVRARVQPAACLKSIP